MQQHHTHGGESERGSQQAEKVKGSWLGGAREFAGSLATAHYPPDLELEPVDLAIGIRIDIEGQTLDVEVRYTLVARRVDARRLTLDGVGFEGLTVEGTHTSGDAIEWSYDGRKLDVILGPGAVPGEVRTFVARYRVVEPVAGVYFSAPSADQPAAPRFVATDHETERARYWLLCVDHPGARPRLAFALRAPAGMTALANGAAAGVEPHSDGTSTSHWRLDAPCPSYLTCFAVGDFVRADDGEHVQTLKDGSTQAVPIAYFGPKGVAPERLVASFGRTGAMLAWIEGLLAVPYPYPKYFQFALPGIGGAMENISLVSWDGQFLLDVEREPEWTWLVDLVNIHEMAHTWFGDHVVCRDFADSWLKESFATFIETVWIRAWHGRDAGDWLEWHQAASYFAETRDSYRRPIVTRRFESSWQLFDRHLYPGGARRLAMLCAELGAPTFWRGVREYLARYAGQGVETDDFRRVMEEVSGRSLARFFDQWLRAPGHPQLHVRFRRDAITQQGTFEIEQKQLDPGGQPTPFAFGLTLAWRVGGVWHERRLAIERVREQMVVPLDAEPEMVRVDPRCESLIELELDPGEDLLLAQLEHSEDARGRYEAAWFLAAAPSARRSRAVGAALAREPFWAARGEMALALARTGNPSALREIAAAIRRERDPQALEPVLRAALGLLDPDIAAAVAERLDAGLPPRARAVALEVLGAQREGAPLERLVAAARTPASSMEPQSAALRALGATRREAALEPLLAALEPTFARADARPAASIGLGELARTLERGPRERAVDRLIAALRDSDRLVALAAVRGLARAGDPRAADALVAFGAGLCVQERVAVHGLARALRAGEAAAADKELERLRAQVRALEDRMDGLDAVQRGSAVTAKGTGCAGGAGAAP